MRILYVARYIPCAPLSGGTIRALHLIRAASGIADVTLVGAESDPSRCDFDLVAPLIASVQLVPPLPYRDESRPMPGLPIPLRYAYNVARLVTRPDPFSRLMIDREAVCRAVYDLLRSQRVDLVVVDYTEVAAAMADVVKAWGGPSVAAVMDVLSVLEDRRQTLLLRQQVGRRRPSIAKWLAVRQLQALERRILGSYTRVAAVSEVDAVHLQRLVAGKQVAVIPNGVDVEYFGAPMPLSTDVAAASESNETLIFTGQLRYRPNIDALHFFVDDILPLIQATRPGVRFWIVGSSPGSDVLDLAMRAGVEVFASVPDVRPYLTGSSVAVVPLRLGSGTRLKILEALAAGRPVVSTSIGAEGLDVEEGRDLLIADTAKQFAAAVVRLLEQPEEAKVLAAQGRDTVNRRYTWDSIGARFQELLRETSGGSVSRGNHSNSGEGAVADQRRAAEKIRR